MNLAQIKQALTRPEALILVMNDFQAKQVLVAWTLYGSEFRETAASSGTSENARATLIRWWTEVDPNLERLAAISGLPLTRVTKIFYRLCAAYLVWPDGTIANDALSLIHGERNAYVRSLMAKQPVAAAREEKGNTDDGKGTHKKIPKARRKS